MLVAGCLLFLPEAKADTDAVTNLGPAFVGYYNGGVGFSFVPTTNLAVTRVGYLDLGASRPIINFWAGTNYVIASYPLIPGAGGGQMVYSNVTLTLLAGQPYSITLQDVPFNFLTVFAFTNLQVAPQLTAYTSETISTNGQFDNFSPNVSYLGPNFSYQIQTTALPQPLLEINSSNANTAMVTWPAPSPGFVLVQNTSLTTTDWTLVTNTVNAVNGTNQVLVSPLTGNQFYRLLHP